MAVPAVVSLVAPLVGRLDGPLVGLSVFTSVHPWQCQSLMLSALSHPSVTEAAVYPALFLDSAGFQTALYRSGFRLSRLHFDAAPVSGGFRLSRLHFKAASHFL